MTAADITVGKEAEDRIAVASNWKLVWWRFRRHHLAMASAVLLIFMYLIVLVPDFFSTQDPERTDARQAFIPVQMVHLFDDGGFSENETSRPSHSTRRTDALTLSFRSERAFSRGLSQNTDPPRRLSRAADSASGA